MSGNLGRSSLRRRRRRTAEDAMRDYDRLPPKLRRWIASADLPWRPRSVRLAYEKAVRRVRNEALAIEELDQLQERLISKDARIVWGEEHPHAVRATDG